MKDSASGADFHAPNIIRIDCYRPLELGGPAWRRARGLMSILDLAEDYRRTHRVRPGALVALPTDRVGGEVRP